MKDNLKNLLIGMFWGLVICALVSFISGIFPFGKSSTKDYKETRDTITDTVTYSMPVPRDSIVLKYKMAKLPIAGTAHQDTVYKDGDTIYLARADSAEVTIPITQKRYSDSLYTAWVSGYMAQLDSIKVNSRSIYITRATRPKRWGVGLQVGYGVNNNKAAPYIGIGVSYNIFNF